VRSGRSRHGFTLVEVLVATAVLATGLLAAVTAFSMASRVLGATRNDTLVSLLAQQKLAEIEVLGRDEIAPGRTTGDFGPDYPEYWWELMAHDPDERNVMRVDLTIIAPEAARAREIRFSTAIF
jgi:type II secretion system protein I